MRHRAATTPGAVLLLVLVVGGCGFRTDMGASEPTKAPIVVSSAAFEDGGAIPAAHTCDGAGTPPPLRWSGVPSSAERVALVVDDPDAPGGTFTHWVVLLRPDETSVPDGIGGYHPPCPPAGPAHHYRFSIYALGSTTGVDPHAIRDAAIASGTLTGTYARP